MLNDMERVFKTKQGELVDVVQHTKDILAGQKALGNKVKIFIGTDSQDKGGKSTYATCICYWYGNEVEVKKGEFDFNGYGVHYIYTKEHIPRLRDTFSRLYKETEYTMEIAEWFVKEFPLCDITVDLDYNVKPNTKSNMLVASTKGWAEAMGLKANIKLDWEDENTKYMVQVATKAADRECRGGGSKSNNRKKYRKEKKATKN